MSSIRVLLVDDDPLVRSGLRLMLDGFSDVTVIGEVGDGTGVLAAVHAHRPDVILMDLRMPDLDGIAATHAVRELSDPPQVIVLTTWDVNDAVVRSIEAGATGFLLKSASPQEIVGAIRAAMNGDAVLSPRSTRRLLDQWGQRDDRTRQQAAMTLEALTERERAVAVAVAEGLTNAEVGRRIHVAEATVKAHLSTIQTKIGARNRVMVAVLTERAGMLQG